MIARLILFLLGYLMVFSVPLAALGFVFRRRLAEAWERRRQRLQGRRNALQLKEHEEQRCFVCDELAQAPEDCFEPGKGWYHPTCFKALLG